MCDKQNILSFSTPQSQKPRLIKRCPMTAPSRKTSNTNLFHTLIKDPDKRKIVLNILSEEVENDGELSQDVKPKVENKAGAVKRRFVHESASSRSRRRMLESCNRLITPKYEKAESSSVPYECLLNGVVAYVEIKIINRDRSGGAKALMRSMGADVREILTKDVTHVIFKVRLIFIFCVTHFLHLF